MSDSSLVSIILLNAGFTIVLYGLFPILFAAFRKKPIKLKTYNVICFVVNIIVAIFIKVNANPVTIGTIQHKNYSFSPCIIWTLLAVSIGDRILKKKGAQLIDLSKRYICKACGEYSPIPLEKCPKCGSPDEYMDQYSADAVSVDKRFKCYKCGADYGERYDVCPKCGAKGKLIERPTNPPTYMPEDKALSKADLKPEAVQLEKRNDSAASFQPTIVSPETGNREQDNSPQSREMVRFCRECGRKLPPESLFCPECGTKVIEIPAQPLDSTIESDVEENRPEETTESGPGPEPTEEKPAPAVFDLSNKGLPPMLRRGFILAEDEEWDKADQYFEKVLDKEPENAYAYLGKLLVEKRKGTVGELKDEPDLKQDRLYSRALRFADEELRGYLESLNDT